jgi:internalin A
MKNILFAIFALSISFPSFCYSADNTREPSGIADTFSIPFNDQILELKVRKKIKMPEGVIRYANIKDVTSLAYSKNAGNSDSIIYDLSALKYFTSLTTITFNGQGVRNLNPLASLTQLENLNLNNNRITDISSLAGLKKLKRVHLMSNQISNLSPLALLPNLEEVSLSANSLKDIGLFAKMAALKSLIIADNPDIVDLDTIKYCKNLEVLNVSNCNLANLNFIKSLTKLHELYATGNGIKTLEPLKAFRDISILHVSNNRISDLSLLRTLFDNGCFYRSGTFQATMLITVFGNPNLKDPKNMEVIKYLKENNVSVRD